MAQPHPGLYRFGTKWYKPETSLLPYFIGVIIDIQGQIMYF